MLVPLLRINYHKLAKTFDDESPSLDSLLDGCVCVCVGCCGATLVVCDCVDADALGVGELVPDALGVDVGVLKLLAW